MRVGEKLAELLAKNGVRFVYGVPGGQSLPLYEGIRKLQDQIQHVLMRDERSAGYAADAYARLTGITGVCDATVGPGATNLVSPLAEAYCSSIPLLAVLSDIPRFWEHRRSRGNASQGIQQLDIFKTVSKWQVAITDPRMLEDTLDSAFRVATTGKPGPVVLSVPVDIGTMDFNFRERERPFFGGGFPRFRSAPDPDDVERAVERLRAAQKAVLVIGGGAHISGAENAVRKLAEVLGVPVLTTISGKGIISEDHPQAFGVTGVFGNPVAAGILKEADLVFFIGSKIGELTTFGFRVPARDLPVIHLDTDPEEIGRNYPVTLPLLGDARLGLEAVLNTLGTKGLSCSWNLEGLKKDLERWRKEKTSPSFGAGEPLKPQAVMGVLNRVLSDDDVVVCDASLSSGWAAAYLKLKKAGRRFIAPRGLAGIGWGAPAAVGAALARNRENRVLVVAGDGGFAYSIQEVEVMKRLDLPVVLLILNNHVLGWIKHAQKYGYDEKYISTDFYPVDFATAARGFGARSYTVQTLPELEKALEQERNPSGPAVLDVQVDQWESPVLRL
jgi:acetolactate synthase-1/2/3 large subunit